VSKINQLWYDLKCVNFIRRAAGLFVSLLKLSKAKKNPIVQKMFYNFYSSSAVREYLKMYLNKKIFNQVIKQMVSLKFINIIVSQLKP
jgi:hypothetical protein